MPIGTSYSDLFSITDTGAKAVKLVSGLDLIKEELSILLNFQKYSLFFGNNMGLDCEKYLHLMNKFATYNLIRSDIDELFRKYGRARITKVEMTFDETNNQLIIDLTVMPAGGVPGMFTMSLSLSDE